MGHFSFIVTILSLTLLICRGQVQDTCTQPKHNCTQTCINQASTCPVMNCDNVTGICNQFCMQGATCGLLECTNNVATCKQNCFNCPKKTKMICSSETCEQRCYGKNCVMECTNEVKKCQQICSDESTCTLLCRGKNTKCANVCGKNSICDIQDNNPQVVTSSPVCNAERCVKNCTASDCKENLLSCDNTKLCNLTCDNGCKMQCGKSVITCNQECRGKTRCEHVCDSSTCNIKKITCSLAADNSLSHAIVLFTSVISLLLITN